MNQLTALPNVDHQVVHSDSFGASNSAWSSDNGRSEQGDHLVPQESESRNSGQGSRQNYAAAGNAHVIGYSPLIRKRRPSCEKYRNRLGQGQIHAYLVNSEPIPLAPKDIKYQASDPAITMQVVEAVVQNTALAEGIWSR